MASNVMKGGFDCEFVQPPPKHLECPVCLLVLKDPHVSSCCGNHFCQPCIQRVQKDQKPCPLCNDSDFNIMFHKGVKREVNMLGVRCPKSYLGCQWKGELGLLEEHITAGPRAGASRCGYVEVECVYRCGGWFQRRLIQEHEEEVCPNRPVEVQMISNLKKIKGVFADNEFLRQEVMDLKGKLSDVVAENKALKIRVTQLEQNQQHKSLSVSPLEFEAHKCEVREMKVAQTACFDDEFRAIRQEMEEIRQQLQRTTAAIKPVLQHKKTHKKSSRSVGY